MRDPPSLGIGDSRGLVETEQALVAGLLPVGIGAGWPWRPRCQRRYGPTPGAANRGLALSAALTFNHPFIDGNKRIGFATATLFLELNGLRFGAPEVEVVLRTLALAAGELRENAFSDWLKANSRRR